tara:strand:+ start:276 stop:830 length:555 start_codon:yes stop_codon:yes gene_type:complete
MTLTVLNKIGTASILDNAITSGKILDNAVTSSKIVAGAGGKILQVVNAKYDTEITMTSTTPADTGLTATITPTSTSNKILVLVSQPIWMERNGGESMKGTWSLLKGSTVLTSQEMEIASGLNNDSDRSLALNYVESYLDSPNTTSATTYKTQQKCNLSSASPIVKSQRGGSGYYSTMTLIEVAA